MNRDGGIHPGPDFALRYVPVLQSGLLHGDPALPQTVEGARPHAFHQKLDEAPLGTADLQRRAVREAQPPGNPFVDPPQPAEDEMAVAPVQSPVAHLVEKGLISGIALQRGIEHPLNQLLIGHGYQKRLSGKF